MKDSPRRRPHEAPALAGAPALAVPATMGPALDAEGEHEDRRDDVARGPGPSAPRYIPTLLVLPEVAAPSGPAAPPLDGAHRFRAAPTPVLRASLELMGYDTVQWARRPMRSHVAGYRFGRCSPAAPMGSAAGKLRSGRFPKV